MNNVATDLEVDTLIVGAGITGLALANALGEEGTDTRALPWLVIEREAEAGGYCRTVLQDGFVWDYSGHFFHFRHPEIETFLRERMPDQDVIRVQKSAGILIGGVRIDFPFQKNIHQLPLPDFLECLHDLYFRTPREEHSFEDMLYSRFGKGIADRFLIPYNQKLYACAMNTLDAEAMGRFFPHADVASIIKNFTQPDPASYNATFTYPRGGAIEYVRALLYDLPPERVSLSESLTTVDVDAHVATTTHRRIAYRRLVSSLPFPSLLEVCGAATAETRASLSWNKVLVFNLGFDGKGQTRDHWLYVPETDYCFYRVGFYDNIFGSDRMSLYVEIGLAKDDVVGDIDALRERVLADLKRIGIVAAQQQLIAWHSVVLDPAYVHINSRGKTAFASAAAALQANDIYTAGRYGGWTYCSIEDNIVEARALAARLNPPSIGA